MEYNKPLMLAFIDFQKAFNTTELPAALRECRIDFRYTKLKEHIYCNASTTVKLHAESYQFGIERGDTLSPQFFKATLENAFKI